jgi:hypothetical protein
MKIVYQMRYSFFGQSGWRSDASMDADILFDPDRLKVRAFYAENIALQSLKDQTDEDFELVVLSSTLMPEGEQKKLKEMCKDMLGKRAHVLFRAPSGATRWFRRYQHKHFIDSAYLMQVVLDDDDAVSRDFTETMRREGHLAMTELEHPQDYVFLSQARGYSAIFRENGVDLQMRNVPFTNLGLALLGPTLIGKTPFATAHRKIGLRHPSRVIYRRKPSYIRAVHDTNDSRAQVSDVPVEGDELARAMDAFPLLHKLLDVRQPTRKSA